MSPPAPRPVYLNGFRQTLFGVFHAPESVASAKAAVLIVPPWGWDEVASYRSRRDWAQRLAAAGHPTLRFALPGTGNSGGAPGDPELVEAWVAAVRDAAAWLKDAGGSSTVAALGLGLGGLLVLESLAVEAPIDALALWATPAAGRNFVRETKAFSRLQAWSGGDGAAGSPLPEGGLEAGGFVLSSETLEALRSLDPDPARGSSPRRALLLGRDGVDPATSHRERLLAAGTEVTLDPGRGWGAMVSHPETSRLPLEVADRLQVWLADCESATAPQEARDAPTQLPQRTTEVAELEVEQDGRTVREAALTFEQPWGRAFGVLTTPVGDLVPDVCAVCFNPGAVSNVGPNRMWVEAARSWAAQGVRSLRVDLQGIGEADGEPSGTLRVEDFYDERYQAQIDAILGALEKREPTIRLMMVGLCAGGYWAFRTAVRHERIQAAVLTNAGAMRWDPKLLAEREARKVSRAIDRRWMGKLFNGEIGLARVLAIVGAVLVRAARSVRDLGKRLVGRGGETITQGIEDDLDRLRESGTRLVLAFSGEEPLSIELEALGLAARLGEWSNLESRSLPGNDHTLREASAQIAARELLEGEADRAAAQPRAGRA
jgi:alpha-beta hydrolase superfamily lysophospholipase